MSRPLLVHIPYSPWSLRARLALDLAGLAHDRELYLPVVGEPRLRLRLRRLRARVTVPVLFLPDGSVLDDSLDISRHALGDTERWGAETDVQRWHDWSEAMLAAGRIRTTRSVRQDPRALRESLPGPVAKLGPAGMAVGRKAVAELLDKYPVDDDPMEVLAAGVAELDAALRTGGRWRSGDALTFADLTAAVGLCFVQAPMTLPLGAAARPHWRVDALVERHPDVLRWRDGILRKCAELTAA